MAVTISAVEGSGDPQTAWKFMPASVTVPAGGSITFMNTGSATHTLTADDGSFDSGAVSGGTSKTIAMPKAGTFTFHCSFHPFMTGTITVTGGSSTGGTSAGAANNASANTPAAAPTMGTSGYNSGY